jgi:hypothetical protein
MPCENRILIAIELSLSSWLVAVRLPGAEKSRLYNINGGDSAALLALIDGLRSRASTKLGETTDVACCFEAAHAVLLLDDGGDCAHGYCCFGCGSGFWFCWLSRADA